MLSVNVVSKRFGVNPILDSVSFSIDRGDRIGLIGPNGSGKSTLLRIVVGDEIPDSGSITASPSTRIGYLRQGFAELPGATLGRLIDGPLQGLISAHDDLEHALSSLGESPSPLGDPNAAFALAQDHFDVAGGYEALDRLNAHLGRFGLGELSLAHPLLMLSGGQKTRAGLAALLAAEPDLLVLDEPTNHLDVTALEWLAEFLRAHSGAVLVVSHDRGFLDNIVTHILELDPDTHQVTPYPGTYTDYVAMKEHQREEHAAAYDRQQRRIASIESDIRGAEHHARTIEANTIDYAVRKKAAKIARPAVVRKRKLKRLLASTDYIERPERSWGLAVDFGTAGAGSRDAVILEGVTVAYGDQPVLNDCSLHISHSDTIAVTGLNGAGKSTLIKVIARHIAPDSGSVKWGPSVQIGYFAQEQDTLDVTLTVLASARSVVAGSESEIRTFLHRFLFGGHMVDRRVAELSYGERARLMLALLVLRGSNVLVLDEPLNHLDLDARERFEAALDDFDGTIVLVSHDRYAIQRLASRVVEIRDGQIIERDPDPDSALPHG